MAEYITNELKEKMQKSIKVVENEIAGIRTGRASPSILQNVKVSYYGSIVPLNQIASITAPEPNCLVVHPWDANAFSEIEKAIKSSNIGLNPIKEHDKLRIPIPPLSQERRVELTKLVKKIGEDGKVALRNLRREAIEKVRAMKDEKKISEDDQLRIEKKIQEITDKFIKEIDDIISNKEKEILND
uniref:Ribosome-recycling factor n=1 Tax=candidate division WOR-3 bacterium TaxID=2052148 RepID=A0A7C4YHD2_UNCW3